MKVDPSGTPDSHFLSRTGRALEDVLTPSDFEIRETGGREGGL
jgi:hypothetical protein